MEVGSCFFVTPQPAEFSVQYKSSPFQIELKESSKGDDHKQNLQSGVKVVISGLKPYWFAYFWGCDIGAFHQAVARDWKDLCKEIIDESFLQDKVLERSKPDLCFETQREIVLKSTRNISEEYLGPSPRSRFPLVAVMVLHEDESETPSGNLHPTDAVALICALHVQDNICTSESNFVFKLSKLSNGQVMNVSNLFTRDSNEDATICLICESERVTIGLLPCRHFSLCESCYDRLDLPKRCPVCRSYVTRFFRHTVQNDPVTASQFTQQTSDNQPTESEESTTPAQTSKNWFKRLFGLS